MNTRTAADQPTMLRMAPVGARRGFMEFFMPRITLETAHSLGREEAARRLKEKFGAVRAKYISHVNSLQEEWVDHTFSFGFKAMGMGISGTVQVEDATVMLVAVLPLAAMLFKRSIEQQIRHELSGLLA
jgi:hypothetical protein